MWFLRKKHISSILEVSGISKIANLKVIDLVVVGLGAMVGCGIFTLTGVIAAKFSGPAIILSYVIAGIATILIALPYAELSSMLPSSGSIYSYTSIAFGEIFGWMAFGVLTLEIVFGGVCAASAIGSYVAASFEQIFHLRLPCKYLAGPFDGGIINLPASAVSLLFGFLCLIGSEGKNLLGTVLVGVKILTIALFIWLALPHFESSNLVPFMPFGPNKVFAGAAILFSAFSGFSVIPTLADSCRNPSRDITLGILGSVILTLLIYVVVATLAVGLAHYGQLDSPEAFMRILADKGHIHGTKFLSWGIIFAMVAVLMIMLQATTRVLMIVSKDGLLPKFFQHLDEKTGKPVRGIVFSSLLFAVLGGTINFEALAQSASIGALGDYTIAMLLVLFFRKSRPDLDRKFRCPFVYLFVSLGVSISLYLLYQQIAQSSFSYWKIATCWLLGFFIFYWMYAFLNSRNKNLRAVLK